MSVTGNQHLEGLSGAVPKRRIDGDSAAGDDKNGDGGVICAEQR